MAFIPPSNHRKYYHATNTPIKKLKKGKELYMGDGEMPIGGKFIYKVYLHKSAKIFSGIQVFKNIYATDKRGNIYWEITESYGLGHADEVEDFCRNEIGIDPDDTKALEEYLENWFLDRNNYTEEGLSIIDELDLFNELGPYYMSEYFANEQADPSFLNTALEKRGYDGRYESEETSPWIDDVPQSVCVFDQSILTVDPTPITDGRRRNPAIEHTIEDDEYIGSISGVMLDSELHLNTAFDLKKILFDDALRQVLVEHLPIAFLKNLYVEDEFRNQGYGSELMSFFIEEASSLGANAIVLESDESEGNDFDLTSWYESYGFERLDSQDANPILILIL